MPEIDIERNIEKYWGRKDRQGIKDFPF